MSQSFLDNRDWCGCFGHEVVSRTSSLLSYCSSVVPDQTQEDGSITDNIRRITSQLVKPRVFEWAWSQAMDLRWNGFCSLLSLYGVHTLESWSSFIPPDVVKIDMVWDEFPFEGCEETFDTPYRSIWLPCGTNLPFVTNFHTSWVWQFLTNTCCFHQTYTVVRGWMTFASRVTFASSHELTKACSHLAYGSFSHGRTLTTRLPKTQH